jgi:hypothetical protein
MTSLCGHARVFASAYMSLVLLACTEPVGAIRQVPGVQLDSAAMTIAVGHSRPVRATVRDPTGKVSHGAQVVWRSLAPSIAGVNAEGVITAFSVGGEARIVAESESHADTVSVYVPLYDVSFDASPQGAYTTESLSVDWPGVFAHTGLERVHVVVQGKNRVLAVDYPKGSVGPGTGGAIWVVKFPAGYEEMYLRYRIKFAAGFRPVRGGKLPGLAGGQGNTGGVRSTGSDGWSARGMWVQDGRLIQYVYQKNQPTDFGQSFRWKESNEPSTLVPGRWHTMQHRIVMNTPGVADGIVQAWQDGVLVLDARDLHFRDIEQLKIDLFQFSTFFGGSTPEFAASRDETIFYDDFLISTYDPR